MGYLLTIPAKIFDDLRKYYNNQNGILNITDRISLIRETEEMPTKHIMTRAEAIALITQHMPKLYDPVSIIDFYVAAGMLEIKEEEENSFAFAIQQHNLIPKNISLSCINNMLAAISAMGYEIKAK